MEKLTNKAQVKLIAKKKEELRDSYEKVFYTCLDLLITISEGNDLEILQLLDQKIKLSYFAEKLKINKNLKGKKAQITCRLIN